MNLVMMFSVWQPHGDSVALISADMQMLGIKVDLRFSLTPSVRIPRNPSILQDDVFSAWCSALMSLSYLR